MVVRGTARRGSGGRQDCGSRAQLVHKALEAVVKDEKTRCATASGKGMCAVNVRN